MIVNFFSLTKGAGLIKLGLITRNKKGGTMKKRAFVFLTLFVCLSIILTSSENKPLAFDDFIQIKRISDPQISPSGKWVAYVVTAMDKEKNSSNSDIWIIPSQGGGPWKLTSSPKSDTTPRWAPDGKKIAFVSARDGSPQIWIINPRGGEAQKIASLSTGVSGITWSSSGDHLAFVSSVYPDCPDDECNKKRNEERAKSPVKAKIFEHLLFRHWNSWRDGKRNHLFVIPSKGGSAVDLTPGDYDTPPVSLGSSHDYTFSPDGKEMCFVRNIDPELKVSLGTNNDLFLTAIQGGQPEKLTPNRANDNSPRYSPDGRFIAFRAMSRPGFEADRYTMKLYDRKTKKISDLTNHLDRSIGEILWSPDSSQIYFTHEDRGRISLSRLSLETRRIERILEGHFIGSIRISYDGQTLFFLKQALHLPAELFSFNLITKRMTRLTNINGELLADIQMNPAEEFWFEGSGGDLVHGFLLKPPHFDDSKTYPLIMLIHGGPQGAWSDNFHFRWNAQMFASPGYVVAMINFHGSTGYGQDFTDSISGDWGGKPYQDIMKGLDFLLDRYEFIDQDRLAAAGASYGGYMINWIEGHTDRFKCLVSHAGVFDLRSMYGETEELWFPDWDFQGTPWTNPEMYETRSPSAYVQNFRTPCLVTHSQNDFRVPVTQGIQLFTALQRMNVPSKMLYFPDEDHFIQKPQNAELWWKTVLGWITTHLE